MKPGSDVLLGGNPNLLTGEDQIGVFNDFTIGLKDTRVFIGIAVELLRNLRERIALLDDVILNLLLFLGVVQTRNSTWLTPCTFPAINTAFCMASADVAWPESATVPDCGS